MSHTRTWHCHQKNTHECNEKRDTNIVNEERNYDQYWIIRFWRHSSSSRDEFWTKSSRLFMTSVITIRITKSIISSQYSFRSRKKSRSRESSFRDWSERLFQQSSMRHLFRESFIATNFLRQASSSSSQSEDQEILSSKISKISENLYSDSSSQSKNFYVRQLKKKSIPRQSFQLRFPKFYQLSQLSKQFYKSLIE